MAIRLVLVRHGLSSFNAKGLIQGRTDDSILTDEGYEQARTAGEALSNINFDKIYSFLLAFQMGPQRVIYLFLQQDHLL